MKVAVAFIIILCVFLVAPIPTHAAKSRFWDTYPPSAPICSKKWWCNEGNATGNWFGLRDTLNDHGVNFALTYTNVITGNPVGGISQSCTYTDNFYFGMSLNLEKLVHWKDATFVISALDRNGKGLSQNHIGNQFFVQEISAAETIMFYALFLEQKFLEDHISFKAGRLATGDDFASSPIYAFYLNNAIDGNPQALAPDNIALTFFPFATWGGRFLARPSDETKFQFGLYQITNRLFNKDYHGLDFSIRPQDGVVMVSQFGWHPIFFKQSMPKKSGAAASSNRSGALSSQNAFNPTGDRPVRRIGENAEEDGYNGSYWFGAYYTPWQSPQFGTTNLARNAYGLYWHANQMVYKERYGSDQGLILWADFVVSPQQNIALLPFQTNSGFVYKGLIPLRDDDYTIFGFAYGKFSRNFARTVELQGNGYPQYEIMLEWGYRTRLTQFAYIQPDIQWIINPGGTGHIPNALVLGVQMGVIF